MLTLADVGIGESVLIDRLQANKGHHRRKLLALGLTRGTVVRVVRRAPLGDPLQIEVRGCSLSLRSAEARQLLVAAVIK